MTDQQHTQATLGETTSAAAPTPDREQPEPAPGSPWEDLRAYVALPRLTSLDVAPDGTWLLVGVDTLTTDRTAYRTGLWRVATDADQPPRRLTRGLEGEQAACLLRDGSVVFTSARPVPAEDEAASDQDKALWCLPSLGGEAYVLARREGGWKGVNAARTADRLVCPVGLRSGLDDVAEDQALRRRRREAKVSAILHEGAGVRHWDHDLPSDTLRLLALDLPEGDEPRLTGPGLRLATPDLGPGLDGALALASDGSFAVASLQQVGPRGQHRSTIVRLGLDDEQVDVLVDEPGHDFHTPVLSLDDRWVACVRTEHSTATEAPHNCLHLLDLTTGEHRDLAPDWPRWASPVGFDADASTLFVVADEDGEGPVFAIDVASGSVRRLTGHGAHQAVVVAPDGSALYALRSAYDEPGSVVRIDPADGASTVLFRPTDRLDEALPPLPGRIERLSTTSAEGHEVPGWLLLPEAASADAPAPLALWIHGGPLNSWNAWSWRWCPWLLVSQGYAVLLPDPSLSTGYGREVVQRGWSRWGSSTFADLMAATDAVVARADIDDQRTCAMGGSFGGYMANWVAGHTDRFRCIVSHASLWNLEAFVGTTDHPWYWSREVTPAMAHENSPHHRAAAISTPMLVIHGDKDYRVPIGEGLSLWWALVQGFDGPAEELPHKFLYFPDENHWVLKPQHAIVWYETVRAFLDTHVHGADFQRSRML